MAEAGNRAGDVPLEVWKEIEEAAVRVAAAASLLAGDGKDVSASERLKARGRALCVSEDPIPSSHRTAQGPQSLLGTQQANTRRAQVPFPSPRRRTATRSGLAARAA